MPAQGSKKILDVPARVTMNERPLEGEGGRVVIHGEDLPDGVRQAEVILNASSDEAMEGYPETAEERRSSSFRIVVYSVEED